MLLTIDPSDYFHFHYYKEDGNKYLFTLGEATPCSTQGLLFPVLCSGMTTADTQVCTQSSESSILLLIMHIYHSCMFKHFLIPLCHLMS